MIAPPDQRSGPARPVALTRSGAARVLHRSLRPAALAVASRAVVLLVAGAVAGITRGPFLKMLTTWDSSWYLKAAAGYPRHLVPGHGNAAQDALGFFPGLPMLIRLVHAVLPVGFTAAGLLVTFATCISAAVAVWWLVDDLAGPDAADRGTTLVLFSPAAFVFSMIYGEGLLITAGAFMLLALRRRRWVVAGLLGAVVSATDPVGVAAVAPCAWAAWGAWKIGERRAVAAPVLAGCGIGGFFVFLWVRVGTPFAWFITQRRGWQGGPLGTSLFGQVGGLFVDGFANPNITIKAVSALVTVVLLVVFFRSRPEPMVAAYVGAVLFLGALSPVVGWSPRLVLRAFPLLALVAVRIPERWFAPVVGMSALAMATLAILAWGGTPATIFFTP